MGSKSPWSKIFIDLSFWRARNHHAKRLDLLKRSVFIATKKLCEIIYIGLDIDYGDVFWDDGKKGEAKTPPGFVLLLLDSQLFGRQR